MNSESAEVSDLDSFCGGRNWSSPSPEYVLRGVKDDVWTTTSGGEEAKTVDEQVVRESF